MPIPQADRAITNPSDPIILSPVPLGHRDDVALSKVRPCRWAALFATLPELPVVSGEICASVVQDFLSKSSELREVVEAILLLGSQRGRDALKEWLELHGVAPLSGLPANEDAKDESPHEFVIRIWMLARQNAAAAQSLDYARMRMELRREKFSGSFAVPDPSKMAWNDQLHRPQILAGLRSMLASEQIVDYMDLRVYEEPGGVRIFRIKHGEPTKAIVTVDEQGEKVIRVQTGTCNLIRFSPTTRDISFSCKRTKVLRELLGLFGRVFFNDAECFTKAPLFHLRMVTDAEALNEPIGQIPRLQRVDLRKIRLRDDIGEEIVFTGKKRRGAVLERVRLIGGSSMTIVSADICLYFSNHNLRVNRPDRLIVSLAPPWGIDYDLSSIHEPAVHAYLEALGIFETGRDKRSPKDWWAYQPWRMPWSDWMTPLNGLSPQPFISKGILIEEKSESVRDSVTGTGLIDTVEVGGDRIALSEDGFARPRIVTSTEMGFAYFDFVQQGQVLAAQLKTSLGQSDEVVQWVNERVLNLGFRILGSGSSGFHLFLLSAPPVEHDMVAMNAVSGGKTPVAIVPRKADVPRTLATVVVSLPTLMASDLLRRVIQAAGLDRLASVLEIVPSNFDIATDGERVWWVESGIDLTADMSPQEITVFLALIKAGDSFVPTEELAAHTTAPGNVIRKLRSKLKRHAPRRTLLDSRKKKGYRILARVFHAPARR